MELQTCKFLQLPAFKLFINVLLGSSHHFLDVGLVLLAECAAWEVVEALNLSVPAFFDDLFSLDSDGFNHLGECGQDGSPLGFNGSFKETINFSAAVLTLLANLQEGRIDFELSDSLFSDFSSMSAEKLLVLSTPFFHACWHGFVNSLHNCGLES